MLELTAENAISYLKDWGLDSPFWRVTELGGGVSNTVLLMESDRARLVLKQALGKLRVEQDWFSDRRRALREAGAMRAVKPYLPSGAVPEVIFEDRENLIFAMTAAPTQAQSWKVQLLSGDVEPATAERIGGILAAIVRNGWHRPEWETAFGDETVFDQLRLDPYYRSTSARHPDLRPHFDRLIEEAQTRRVSLVHGDWSPKNFLVAGGIVVVIDFEVIHFGDPSFDSAFLLNHLLLKSFYRPQWRDRYAQAAGCFWQSYLAQAFSPVPEWAEPATIRHLGGLLLARIDGKSPAEYVKDEALREKIRQFARELILHPPTTVRAIFEAL